MPLPLGGEHGLPYSRGLMARALMAVGVAPDRAYALARRLGDDLASRNTDVVELDRLECLAVESLGEVEGSEAVRQLRRYQELRELEMPLVILVGGATGTGKSTVATETAHRLGITRVTSTDFIRQTIRAYFPPSEMPSVHVSSFEAGGDDGVTVDGFLDQTRRVLVGVSAAVERALTEGWSMAIEGVHLVPGLVPTAIEGALLVHAVLHVESVEEHRSHFVVRDVATGGSRTLEKYLDGFAEIRLLQELIVDRARREGVPVIDSTSLDAATGELLDLVLSRAESLEPAR
jgi:2-phosphoglycerate kinase